MQPLPPPPVPRWQSLTLRLAGIYNLLWGAWVVLFPLASLRVCGYSQPPTYPEHWQCIGMIVGVYGIGYWIAASQPIRHWPIVLVGLLGKVLGPLGFLWAWGTGRLPLSAGLVNIFNDVIWWVPFTCILLEAFRQKQTANSGSSKSDWVELAPTALSQTGETIAGLSARRPLLLVFLRHDGCTFCRETLAQIAGSREQLERAGTGIAFVHMADNSEDQLFRRYGLEGLPRFSDPRQELYEACELANGKLGQLFSASTIWRGFQAAVVQGHGFGPVRQNVFRLPGAFVIRQGKIIAAHRHRSAGEHLDHAAFACNLNNGLGDL